MAFFLQLLYLFGILFTLLLPRARTQDAAGHARSLSFEPATIILQKRIVEVTEGFEATVFFTLKGNPNPTVRAYFKGKHMNDSRVTLTSNSFRIRNVQQSDNGMYEFYTTNKAGQMMVDFQLLVEISSPPVLKVTDAKVKRVQVGGKVRFRCVIYGNPKPTVVWYYNSTLLSGRRFPRISIGTNSLTVVNVTKEDTGNYLCHGDNNSGRTIFKYVLKVHRRGWDQKRAPGWCPSYTRRKEVAEGGSVRFVCEAEGYPTPTIYWLKDGRPFQKSAVNKFTIKHGRLTIDSLTREDSGLYTCNVTNSLGFIHFTYILSILY